MSQVVPNKVKPKFVHLQNISRLPEQAHGLQPANSNMKSLN
jgi:hypothetical protein